MISSLYYYDRWVTRVIDLLEAGSVREGDANLERVKDLFIINLEPITAGNGLYTASDIRVPEQASLVVPNLKILIVPLVYGDHHSWNTAYLTAEGTGVALHRHRRGAEIHLGFSPVKGRTILGTHAAPVQEGYATPIPPMTDHGFENLSGHDHFLPFISPSTCQGQRSTEQLLAGSWVGSLPLGGWGIFFDVEPRPRDLSSLKEAPVESPEMNHTIRLERAIHQAAAQKGTTRRVLIPVSRAGAPEIGGLELAVTRVDSQGLQLTTDRFRIISIRSGKAKVCVGQVERELTEHDHLGIPARMLAHIAQAGEAPLVILDATIRPVDSSP